MNYILVVDDEADIRDIYEMVLKRSFPLDVVLAESGNKALKIIEERGKPEIILSDLKMPDGDGQFLYNELQARNIKVPFVICSTDSASISRTRFPGIHGYIEKPNIIGPVQEVVAGIVTRHKEPPGFVPVSISLLLRWGSANFDLFMKLSESKFIKVINAGEAFVPADAERFHKKGLHHLHITLTDTDVYLKTFEQNINTVLNAEGASPEEVSLISLEALTAVEQIAASLGWNAVVLHVAKKAVDLAIKAVSQNPDVMKLLKLRLASPASRHSEHISKLSLLTCGLCYQLGWTSEFAQMKLGLASLLHDLTVDESCYQEINLWNEAAVDSKIKTPEAIKYRNHPTDAVNLLLSFKDIPADVDQIILQHHEKKDGTGFPRGLTSSRITPMACVFIIVEDLINFLEDYDNIDERIGLFLKHKETVYNSGNFKKVFDAFKESVQNSRR